MAQINPLDAQSRDIESGDFAEICSPRGKVKMKVEVTEKIIAGAIHLPHHWKGAANVNILVDDMGLDPISGFAPFKSQLCQVKKL